MRMLAAIVIQPLLKRKITPERLLPFPWERPLRQNAECPPLSAAESLKRFEEMVNKAEG